ncbi:Cysteine/histidine-rich domain [Ostreococcus tauri]|uniref:Cysteine/histidine-rich domain n=1 Tax=Ostreococcus tauri TaxID=70448 RepID=A0A090N4C0_OSTTA|nr:Cysteine/histidine-rich domain [Ostreococcus tauri]CEF99603.1 Cysteine/histidine-rich domain [Ostreococcus tauri]|eukprot:XP_022839925.1 Cysteine/histidine-rich domain [Ostreococcus tauri]
MTDVNDDLDALPKCSRPDGKYMCQRLGCDALYLPGPTNVDGECVHHVAKPVFHDGVKSWPCCGKSSHDFGEFMSIRGCVSGRHTCRKITYENDAKGDGNVGTGGSGDALNASPAPAPMRAPIASTSDKALGTRGPDAQCQRCAQGFYCAEHASNDASEKSVEETKPEPIINVDPDAWQTCKRPGCGLKFRERDNAGDACVFHSGAPIFHETKKGWSCCTADKLVYDFDDFLKIAPCARGRHDANAAPLQFQRSSATKR